MAYTTIQRVDGFAQPTDGLNGNLTITGRTLTHYTVVGAAQLTPGWTGSLTTGNIGYNPYQPYSSFSNVVNAIEYVGSIELLGDPTTNNAQFRVAISGAAPSASTGATSLQAYCNAYVTYGSGVAGTQVLAFTY
jgi:hypothetical protein